MIYGIIWAVVLIGIVVGCLFLLKRSAKTNNPTTQTMSNEFVVRISTVFVLLIVNVVVLYTAIVKTQGHVNFAYDFLTPILAMILAVVTSIRTNRALKTKFSLGNYLMVIIINLLVYMVIGIGLGFLYRE